MNKRFHGLLIDMTGRRFGRWTVLALHPERRLHKVRWLCRCDCGTGRVVYGANLRNGSSTSCGCVVRERMDLTGKRFGRWLVLGVHSRPYRSQKLYWLCRCDCGTERVVLEASLRRDRSTSCGCFARERNTTHGLTGTRAYRCWQNMKGRCFNPGHPQYPNYYGGRGITVCELKFENFYADMGDPPPGLSLDRIDNDGSYEKANCRWATPIEQARNQRPKRKRRRASLAEIQAHNAVLARAASAP